MVSRVQKLKKLVDVKIGRRKPRPVENKKLAQTIEDARELLALRDQIDLNHDAKERAIAAFLERFDVPRRARKATLRVGGRSVTVRFSD